jgi:hypothetical protein
MNDNSKINIDSNSVTLRDFGFQQASSISVNPQVLDESLNQVFQQFVEDQRNLLTEKRKKIIEIDSVITKLNNEIFKNDESIKIIEDKITSVKEDIQIIREGQDATSGVIPLVIGSFIVILLTFYLFIFYSSTIYTVIYGVTSKTQGILNPNVFVEALNKGGGVIALLVLFPTVFLGVGFLFHNALEKKQFMMIIIIIFFTFIADALIGYSITKGVYQSDYSKGLHNKEWELGFAFTDVNFYIILFLGFVVYLIWGGLLHFVLNKNKEISEPERIKSLKSQINDFLDEISKIKSIITVFRNDISDLVNQKSMVEVEINRINSNKLVDPSGLRDYVGQFSNGLNDYISSKYKLQEDIGKMIMDQCRVIKELWLTSKIETA